MFVNVFETWTKDKSKAKLKNGKKNKHNRFSNLGTLSK